MIRRAPLLGIAGLRHGFFGRAGGVSSGAFASLNCAGRAGDSAANVSRNRARVAALLGVLPERLICADQGHTEIAVCVEGPWGRGGPARADALASRQAGLALGIVTADCAPVLLADLQAGVIGAAHAGWRGALGGILEAALAAMEHLGAARGRIRAAIGPCIPQADYEVGAELRARFIGHWAGSAAFFRPGRGKWVFDLSAYCAARLAELEVGEVWQAGAEGSWGRDFFSRRAALARGSAYGGQISALALIR